MKLKKLGLFRKIPNRFFVTKAKESDTKITIDSELSSTSENPVQNKVITEALENAGKKLYLHHIEINATSCSTFGTSAAYPINKMSVMFTYICSRKEPFQTVREIKEHLKASNPNFDRDVRLSGTYSYENSGNYTANYFYSKEPFSLNCASDGIYSAFYWYDEDTQTFKTGMAYYTVNKTIDRDAVLEI